MQPTEPLPNAPYTHYHSCLVLGCAEHMLLSCPILNSTLLKNRLSKNFASAVSYFCCVLNFFPLGCFTCITDLKNLLPDCFHTSAEAKRHLLCMQDVSAGRQNSMQKERFAPAAMYLFHLNTYLLPLHLFLCIYISHRYCGSA